MAFFIMLTPWSSGASRTQREKGRASVVAESRSWRSLAICGLSIASMWMGCDSDEATPAKQQCAGRPSPACTAVIDQTHVEVGLEGAKVSLGQLTLEIPPGALPENTTITLSRLDVDSVEGLHLSSPVFYIEPDDVQLSQPVRLGILPSGGAETAFTWVGDTPTPVPLDHVDPDHRIWVLTDHFSPWALGNGTLCQDKTDGWWCDADRKGRTFCSDHAPAPAWDTAHQHETCSVCMPQKLYVDDVCVSENVTAPGPGTAPVRVYAGVYKQWAYRVAIADLSDSRVTIGGLHAPLAGGSSPGLSNPPAITPKFKELRTVDAQEGPTYLVSPGTPSPEIVIAVNSVAYGPNNGVYPWDTGPWEPSNSLVVESWWYEYDAAEVRFLAPAHGPARVVSPLEAQPGFVLTNAVGSTYPVVEDGQWVPQTTTGITYDSSIGNARTAIGVDSTGRYLLMFANGGQLKSDADRTAKDGFTAREVHDVLTVARPFLGSQITARHAMLLDGGHATQMWVYDATKPRRLRCDIAPKGYLSVGDGPHGVVAGLAVSVGAGVNTGGSGGVGGSGGAGGSAGTGGVGGSGGTTSSESCTDGIKNQNEISTDCGGVCSGLAGYCPYGPNSDGWYCGNSAIGQDVDKLYFCVDNDYSTKQPISCTDACRVNGVCVDDTCCGDGKKNGTEQCDGTSLGSATCISQGFSGGTLKCSTICTFDTSSCTTGPKPCTPACGVCKECDTTVGVCVNSTNGTPCAGGSCQGGACVPSGPTCANGEKRRCWVECVQPYVSGCLNTGVPPLIMGIETCSSGQWGACAVHQTCDAALVGACTNPSTYATTYECMDGSSRSGAYNCSNAMGPSCTTAYFGNWPLHDCPDDLCTTGDDLCSNPGETRPCTVHCDSPTGPVRTGSQTCWDPICGTSYTIWSPCQTNDGCLN